MTKFIKIFHTLNIWTCLGTDEIFIYIVDKHIKVKGQYALKKAPFFLPGGTGTTKKTGPF